jgi:alpha-glucoside transport system substrate-binding protein
MTYSSFRYVALLMLMTLSVTSLHACSNQNPKAGVTVLAPWTDTDEEGGEGNAFKQILDKFTDETGIQVKYLDTRAITQVLLSNVQAGNPPHVAVLPYPSELAKYARNGQLYPLDDVIDEKQQEAFSRPWLLPQQKDGSEHIYTVPVKANLKSAIWFNSTRKPQPEPQTWEDLVAYSRSIADTGVKPWCMGMGDAPSSGWPGTDLIEDIFLSRFGQELYRQWAAGTLPWNSDQVREAWTAWGEIAVNLVHGGPHAALLTNFADSGRSMFTNPPGCFLEHQGSFIMGFYQDYKNTPGYEDRPNGAPQLGTDFDFFPFPASSNQNGDKLREVSADLAGMFDDTPEARQLMNFLAKNEAQQIWPAIAGAGAFVINKNVNPEVYPDEVSKRIDTILRFSDSILCFDASDLMPATMRNAYNRAVLEYLNDPSQLDKLLERLDKVRGGIPPEDWLNLPCGQ